jgi:hypothetical protein
MFSKVHLSYSIACPVSFPILAIWVSTTEAKMDEEKRGRERSPA